MCNKLADDAVVVLTHCNAGKYVDRNPALRIMSACNKVRSVITCSGCTAYAQNDGKPYCKDGLRQFSRAPDDEIVSFDGPALKRDDNGDIVEPGLHFHQFLRLEKKEERERMGIPHTFGIWVE